MRTCRPQRDAKKRSELFAGLIFVEVRQSRHIEVPGFAAFLVDRNMAVSHGHDTGEERGCNDAHVGPQGGMSHVVKIDVGLHRPDVLVVKSIEK